MNLEQLGERFDDGINALETIAEATKLAECLTATIESTAPAVDLAAVRAALNEAGIRQARAACLAAPDLIATALLEHRNAAELVKTKAAALDAAQVEAEWELDARFVTEGAKTFLLLKGGLAGTPTERKAMTADERKQWKARKALENPTVVAAEQEHREALYVLGGARDAVEVARARYSVAKRDVDGAVAELSALATVLQTRGTA